MTELLIGVGGIGLLWLLAWLRRQAIAEESRQIEADRMALYKQRERFERIMQASERPPAAPGYPHNRVG